MIVMSYIDLFYRLSVYDHKKKVVMQSGNGIPLQFTYIRKKHMQNKTFIITFQLS